MQKTDWRRELKHLYGPSAREVVEVEVPEMRFLMSDGVGDPDAAPFKDALGTLYAVSYALKFMVRERAAIDYAVSPAEGLWSGADPSTFGLGDEEDWKRTAADRRAWEWTLMSMQPEPVTEELFREARERVEKRKGPAAVSGVRLGTFREGRAAQVMHRGPYAEEWPTIKRVHHFIAGLGGEPAGKHHEIYLNDPFRTTPENLRTVIRQPFSQSG